MQISRRFAAAPALVMFSVVAGAQAQQPTSKAEASQSGGEPIVRANAPERARSLEPAPARPSLQRRVKFQSDPIADGAIILVSLGSAGVLDLINSTGELRPQQISPNFDRDQLVSIDRAAITQEVDPNASSRSNLGIGLAGVYALIDPVLSGFRERSVQAGVVDAILYAETVSLTLALTSIVKLAVRRPRPIAYQEAEKNRDDPEWSNSSTDSSLSFFSGHASMTAAIGATATYLAFARSPGTYRPWLTLSVATVVTTFVSVERVRAGKHFPTDVLAGAFAGIGIGVVVPHLHRTEDVQQRRVWVGFTPMRERERLDGGTLTLTGLF
jgi:membrane-associated phospholipid phosphatase